MATARVTINTTRPGDPGGERRPIGIPAQITPTAQPRAYAIVVARKRLGVVWCARRAWWAETADGEVIGREGGAKSRAEAIKALVLHHVDRPPVARLVAALWDA